MLDNKFIRAAVFFVVAFGIPLVLGAYFGDIDQGIRIGVVMGVIFAVMSQFFEPRIST